jgi:hypothetical protein
MKSRVSSRARLREDRAGDPLDGLVNLFDLGIVLAVAFLLAALSSIELSPSDLRERQESRKPEEVVVQEDEEARQVPLQPGDQIVGEGEEIGKVYRLKDGRTVLVRPEPGR